MARLKIYFWNIQSFRVENFCVIGKNLWTLGRVARPLRVALSRLLRVSSRLLCLWHSRSSSRPLGMKNAYKCVRLERMKTERLRKWTKSDSDAKDKFQSAIFRTGLEKASGDSEDSVSFSQTSAHSSISWSVLATRCVLKQRFRLVKTKDCKMQKIAMAAKNKQFCIKNSLELREAFKPNWIHKFWLT